MKHSSVLPYAFTEHGVAMLASVLNSERAIRISIGIVQAFVRLRRLMASQTQFARKLAQLESRLDTHDGEIAEILNALRNLMKPPEEPKRKIGFQPPAP